jgi:hypothetical protein
MDQLRAADVLGKDWVAAVLLLVIGMVAWVNMASPRQWTVIQRSFFALRLGKQSLRDELSLQDRTLVALLAVAMVLIGLFSYQVAVFNAWAMPGIALFGRIQAVVAAVFISRILLLRGLAVLTGADGGTDEYIHTLVTFTIALGLVLLPVAMLIAYPFHTAWRSWLWLAGVAMAAAVLLFRWLRATVIGIGSGVPLRYIFLYLCAAEILPVALVLQQVRQYILPPSHPL